MAKPLTCNDSSGSGTAQTCTTNPAFNSQGNGICAAAGDWLLYKTTTTNTGALTLQVNGGGGCATVGVQKRQGTVALANGDLVAGHYVLLVFDGTNWDLTDPITQ
jgi:hypothetical protein